MPYANTTRVIRQLQEAEKPRKLADAEAVAAMRAAQADLRADTRIAAE